MKEGFYIRVVSEITGQIYDSDDVVWYGNALQSAQYFLWGATPVDFDVSSDTGKWVFAIKKEDHKKFIGRWNAQRQSKDTEC